MSDWRATFVPQGLDRFAKTFLWSSPKPSDWFDFTTDDARRVWQRFHPPLAASPDQVIESGEFIAIASKLPPKSRRILVRVCAAAAESCGAWYGEAADKLAKTLGWASSDGPAP